MPYNNDSGSLQAVLRTFLENSAEEFAHVGERTTP